MGEDDRQERLRSIVEASDAVIDEEGGSPDPVARRRVAEALRKKIRALRALGRDDELIATCRVVVLRAEEEPEERTALPTLAALYGEVGALLRLGPSEEALAVADELLERLDAGEVSDALEPLSAGARLRRWNVLVRLGWVSATADAEADIIDRFSASEHPRVRSQVAFVLDQRAKALLGAGRTNRGHLAALAGQTDRARPGRDAAARPTGMDGTPVPGRSGPDGVAPHPGSPRRSG